MSVVAIVVITLFAYWILSTIIFFSSKQNETVGCGLAMGLIFPILYILFYPVRAMNTYSQSKGYYQKHGISRIQYLFGKRVKSKKEWRRELNAID